MRNETATPQNAAQTPDEAGATPPSDARCVPGTLGGSLPPRGAKPCANRLGREKRFEFVNRLEEEEKMAVIKKPPESVSRSLKLDQPVSDLLDDYARFVDCTADYVANFALRKTLARDPDYKKWKATQNGASSSKRGTPSQQAGKPS